MMKQNKIYFLSIIFIFSLASFSYCEKIIFSADSMSGVVGDKSDTTTLEGEAYVLTESMEISANKIMMYGDDFRYIEAEGSIVGKNMESELEFTCGKLKYDRETKVATLSEGVNLKDIKNEVTVKGHLIEYDQNTDIAVMQIDIELLQKDNVCTGVYAIYRKNEQMLELSGNAQIKQGSDIFRAQHITMDLDSQEIVLDGRVKGSVVDERKTEDKTEETTDTGDGTTTEDGTGTDGNSGADGTDGTGDGIKADGDSGAEGTDGETNGAGGTSEKDGEGTGATDDGTKAGDGSGTTSDESNAPDTTETDSKGKKKKSTKKKK